MSKTATAVKNAPFNKAEFCRQKPTLFGVVVKTGKISARNITTIPDQYAKRLGLVVGLTDMMCTLENGALVYRPYTKDSINAANPTNFQEKITNCERACERPFSEVL